MPPFDPSRGLLCTQAADGGETDATYALGAIALEGGCGGQADPVRGLDLLTQAAQRGHVDALMTLASIYDGSYRPEWTAGRPARSPAAAARDYLDAAVKGSHEGLYNLGCCWSEGIDGVGVANMGLAAGLFAQAALAGSIEALDALAKCYRKGLGVGADSVSARTLARQPARAREGPGAAAAGADGRGESAAAARASPVGGGTEAAPAWLEPSAVAILQATLERCGGLEQAAHAAEVARNAAGSVPRLLHDGQALGEEECQGREG